MLDTLHGFAPAAAAAAAADDADDDRLSINNVIMTVGDVITAIMLQHCAPCALCRISFVH